ncbi:uncharacterized protein LOC114627584 [Grammomys surdaster]|uniref:uncharacterized protein LOC114627584 n=1 Tax=Grammomys surdaster TaxID=491861 RepID=UPI00109F3D09|nr:uncharacterized protein LOC114627584 [Grammomys surdaster]XP_028631306.1 uncharacterized protein LOC114627584 [Grammomys surdaster]
MGQIQTTPTTPLSLFLDHFKDYKTRARRRGLVVKKKRLTTFCREEWPTFNVGWPPSGTLNLPVIFRTKDIISGRPGHPDQVPYIITWLDVVQNPPKWLKPWLPLPQPSATVLAQENSEKRKTETNSAAPLYPVLQGSTEEDLLFSHLPYRSPPGGRPGPQPEAPEGAQGFPLVIPPHTQEKAQQKLSSRPGPQPEVPEAAQGFPLVSPPHTQEKAQQELPGLSAAESTVLTLRATGPQDDRGNQLMKYCPLDVRELYNWKYKYPPFSEKPAALINLLESVFLTHQPTWDDCQLLLRIFFTTKEREEILLEAVKLVAGANNNQTLVDTGIYTRPYWDFNSANGKENLRAYHQTLIRSLRVAGQGPAHLAKVCSVYQENTESPAAFLERILEAYRTYTSLDPEAPENKSAVIMAFVRQAAPDIRRYLMQRIDRLGEMSLQELLVVAGEVIDNREILKKKQLQAPKELQNQRLARICMALSADSPEEIYHQLRQLMDGKGKWPQQKGKPKLKKNQCAYCKKMGHWIKDCPKKPPKRDKGGQGSYPLPEPRVSLKVEEKPISFLVDTEAQYSDQTQSRGKLSSSLPNELSTWLTKFPSAWAETGGMGLVEHRAPICVELKPEATPVQIRQDPVSQDVKAGITPHIRRLRDSGILVPCRSPWNSPLLPIKKANSSDYRLVMGLREVNKRVMDIPSTVPNPYTLLSLLTPSKSWYTVLDLKDAVLSLRLAPQSQPLFAFEWHNPEKELSGQLTWTRLPQGFKNSTTIFYKALHEDLGEYRQEQPNTTLLQYVDDLLVAAETMEECQQSTKDLLMALGTLGYRASAKKAQICQQEVTYLGCVLKGGQRWLSEARKYTILKIPTPTTRQKVRQFLGSVNFCRLWVPNFAELAKPLSEATKKEKRFQWTEAQEDSFNRLKQALKVAPALTLLDITKPFHLYIDESKGIAKGVLTQMSGSWNRPVAYLSKELDPVVSRWPSCLRIIAATALLVKDADKLTLEQVLHITTPHAVERVLKQPPGRWVSSARMTCYPFFTKRCPEPSLFATRPRFGGPFT